MKALIRWTALLFTPALLHAQTLDWDEVNWSRGSENQTFSNVQGSGIDISIGLTLSTDSNSSGQTTQWSPSGTASPDDNNIYGGDWGARNEESLYLKPDFATDNRESSYLDVTITFSQAVRNVSFSIFDIDVGLYYTSAPGLEFEDIIEGIAGSYNGQDVDATVTAGDKIVVDTTTNPGDTLYHGNTFTNDGGYDQNDNPGSVINLTFADPVQTINFRYSSGSRAEWNPGDQAIGVSDIGFSQYNAVPEPGTVAASLLMMGFLGLFAWKRKTFKASSRADRS